MLIAIVLLVGALGSETVNHKVQIDGRTYRVEVKGRTVEAFDKSLVTGRTPERGDKLRRAVKEAPGCEMKDEYWAAAHLTGLLDCPANVTPAQ